MGYDTERMSTPDSSDPLIGTTLAGRYHIEGRVGVGAMGAVYSAVQEGLGRRVALKVLKRDLNWGGDTVARFRREAHAMSALMHPNTVRVYDFGATPDGLLYLAMELLEGELATARLFRAGALDVDEAVSIAQQILRSVSEAHAKKIIHRDLKPDNIFLARVDGQSAPMVKVLDFGIAKAVEGDRTLNQFETQDGTVFGTPRYMSPEQAQGKALDARSDLYAVGIILYELLTGSAPFIDDDAVIVMAKHIRETITPVRKAAPDRPIPSSLEAVVTRALEKDPNKRFESADAFDQALEACKPDLARVRASGVERPSLVEKLRDVPVERKRSFAIAGVSLLVGAIATAILLLAQRKPDTITVETLPEPAASLDANVVADSIDEDPMITVESDPIHATVWFDGQVLGVTPIAVVLPQGKPMRVELRKEGFLMTQVDLTAGAATQRVTLEPQPSAQPVATPTPNLAPVEASETAVGTKRPRVRPRVSHHAKKAGNDTYERFE